MFLFFPFVRRISLCVIFDDTIMITFFFFAILVYYTIYIPLQAIQMYRKFRFTIIPPYPGIL